MSIPPFTTTVAMTAIQLFLVLTPVLSYGVARRSKEIWVASLVTFVLCLVQSAILVAPSIGWFATLKFNWLQKALAFACCLFWSRASGFANTDCGFALPKRNSAFALALIMGLVLGLSDYFASMEHMSKASIETVLFELTMPGLQEEALYRG